METVRGAVPVGDGRFKSAIFFDNDEAKVEQVRGSCPSIVAHTVPEIGYQVPPTPFDREPMISVIAASGGQENLYLKFLRYSRQTVEYYDHLSGFSAEVHRPIIEEWVASLEDPTTAIALFDWDRTITKFEGMYLPHTYANVIGRPRFLTAANEMDFYEDVLRFVMGSDARLAEFRDMCLFLGTNNINVGVLTNNGLCPSPVFTALVNKLFPPEVTNLFILCSKPPPSSTHKGNKLRSVPNFNTLCGIMGGRRHRQRRIRKTRRTKGAKPSKAWRRRSTRKIQ